MSSDARIVFYGDRRAPEQRPSNAGNLPSDDSAMATSQSPLSPEQQALVANYQIESKELLAAIAEGQERNEPEIARAARLLRLIDRILMKHHPGISCKQLICYQGRAYKVLLKKRQGREHLEFFTSDLIDDLVVGKVSGLVTLEGIIAGAVAKLN